MELDTSKPISIVGAARSGRSAAELLARHGVDSIVYDSDGGRVLRWMREIAAEPWSGRVSHAHESDVARAGCLVLSPGVPVDAPIVRAARERGARIIGEVELAWNFCRSTLVCVTGTNGKSTTVGIIGDILTSSGYTVAVAGNVGTPFSSVVDGAYDIVVLELSSFQLDTIDALRARVAVLLNVTPDHLDRYQNRFDAYVESKQRILRNRDENTHFVYNRGDPVGVALAAQNPGTNSSFGFDPSPDGGVSLVDDVFVQVRDGNTIRILERNEFTPLGLHNAENAMAAIAAVIAFDVPTDTVASALRKYRPLPHRMELVRVLAGVWWVNDSKATNVDAAIRSIESARGCVVVILGGRDKDGDFTLLRRVGDRVRLAVLIGEASAVIAAALGSGWECTPATSMGEAVAVARSAAQPGDTVLLAPACASFDMFDNYEQRGEVFRQCVEELEESQ